MLSLSLEQPSPWSPPKSMTIMGWEHRDLKGLLMTNLCAKSNVNHMIKGGTDLRAVKLTRVGWAPICRSHSLSLIWGVGLFCGRWDPQDMHVRYNHLEISIQEQIITWKVSYPKAPLLHIT